MARFLSAEWFDLVNRAGLRLDPGLTLTLEQRVTGTPQGVVEYRVSMEAGRLYMGPGDGAPADVVLVTDYDTAVGLATGAQTAHDAFRAGRLRVSGDLECLGAAAPALAELASSLASVRERTTY